jgi:hypothetical protein
LPNLSSGAGWAFILIKNKNLYSEKIESRELNLSVHETFFNFSEKKKEEDFLLLGHACPTVKVVGAYAACVQ